jgi:Holliday junction resolvasome RuvABC endonuclease subunit
VKRVIGLDLSITGTGIARHDGSLERPKYPKGVTGDRRLIHLTASIRLAAASAELAVVEKFVSTRSAVANLSLGMVHGITRKALLQMSVPYVLVGPGTVKKFATGDGNADKSDMRMAWFKRTGEDVRDDNMVDAAWLRQIGLHLTGDPDRLTLPKTQTGVLKAILREDQGDNESVFASLGLVAA